jgi:hypothetical protein
VLATGDDSQQTTLRLRRVTRDRNVNVAHDAAPDRSAPKALRASRAGRRAEAAAVDRAFDDFDAA